MQINRVCPYCFALSISAALIQVAYPVERHSEQDYTTIGSYQVYKSEDAVWLLADIDSIIHRGPYSEPPIVPELRCVRIFEIREDGKIYCWRFGNALRMSANRNFSYLAIVSGDVVLISGSFEDCALLKRKNKRLSPPKLYKSLAEAEVKVNANESLVDVKRRLLQSNEAKKFYRIQTEHFGFVHKQKKLPEGLVKIDLRFKRNPNGWGAKNAIATSLDKDDKWSQILIDVGASQSLCRVGAKEVSKCNSIVVNRLLNSSCEQGQ